MLYHHSTLPYEVALHECAERTKAGYQKLLNRGQTQLPGAIETLQTVPDDTIVKGKLLDLVINETNVAKLCVGSADEHEWSIHENAWDQMCAKAGFPKAYGEKLRTTDWGRELVSLNFNTIFANALEKKRFLIRSVRGQARGFLSDRYRRLDMRPIMEKIFGIAQEMGAIVIGATATDTKAEVKFAFPRILEPIPDEPILFWVSARASDFGESKVEIALGLNKTWCTNDAKVDTIFGQVHLGRQLPEDIEFSEETYRKDTAAVVSATSDVFRDAFSEKRVERLCEAMIKAANTDAPKDIAQAMKNAGLSKSEIEAGSLLYAQPDLEVLPKGDTMWRFSNTVSFLAHSATPERRLELEEIAGDLINAHQKKTGQAVLSNVA